MYAHVCNHNIMHTVASSLVPRPSHLFNIEKMGGPGDKATHDVNAHACSQYKRIMVLNSAL